MITVKLKADCFNNHYPPHCPWYINNYKCIIPLVNNVELLVEEWNHTDDVYYLYGINTGEHIIEIRRHYYMINKKDCEL